MFKAIAKTILWLSIIVGAAFIAASQCLSAQPNDIARPAALVLKKAYDLLDKKETFKAIEILEAFLEQGEKDKKPGKPDEKGYEHYLIPFTLGNCYLLADNPSKAISWYNETVKKKPDFSAAWLNLAKSYYESNTPRQAANCFLKGYDTSADKKPEALYYAAVSFMAADDAAAALETFARILADHGDQVKLEWKETIAQAYLAAGQPRKALPFIEELSEKFTGNKKIQWQEIRLNYYMNLNMNQRAVEYAGQLAREYPIEPKWWKALTHLHLMENRHEKALVALTVYGHLAPLTVDEKKLMAELNLSIGVPLQATRFYKEILAEKKDPVILKKLVESCLYLHRQDEALKWVETGLQNNPDEELLMLKGNLLYENKNYEAAMEAFESIAQGENSGTAMLMLGYSAWNTGNLDKAKYAFQKASKHPKHHKTALKLLQQIAEMEHQEKS